ncbi:MAG: hypothetical protein CM15mP58_19100 [Burkholderiaceae bacterium]|nr:MAG: hypothetical protein CM15mP58_19100 [Burkholderiaceae bacterium]
MFSQLKLNWPCRSKDVEMAIKKDTGMISILCMCNEIGTIQSLQKLIEISKKIDIISL